MVFSILPVLWYRKFLRKSDRFLVVLDVRSLPNRIGNGIVGQLNLSFFNMGLQIAGRYFDGCMAITSAMSTYIGQNSSFDVKKIGIWSSAFDEEIFNPELVGKSEAMKNIASPCVIYHGAIANNRMLLELVEAISLTKTKVNLFVLGGGPLLPRLLTLTAELGLQDRITFHDPVSYSEVPMFLNSASIGMVPIPDSLWFRVSMPIKLLEYMAMNLPVVAPFTEPVKNVLQKEKCNIECFDLNGNIPLNIAKAIDKVVDQLGGEMTFLDNRQHVTKRFSWRIQSQAIHSYLANLAN
jgi:glycosyltransferase involved in cell wall biosynthesis